MQQTKSYAALLASETEATQRKLIAGIEEAALYDWKLWGRPNQIAPAGDWLTWVILAGRGFGKTRAGSEWVKSQVCGSTPLGKGKAGRVALVAETAADARDVIVKGDSGLLQVHHKDFRPVWQPSNRSLTWPNGAIALLFNATEPDQLRGPQHDLAWCFIAGTQVETEHGPRAIESLRRGDRVWTRKGLRSLKNCSVRTMPVGRVTFGNGEELVGTAEHPVLTSHGWTMMSNLREGDVTCAIAVSSGAASAGIATAAITSIAAGAACAMRTAKDFIALFGSTITAPFLMGVRFTTATGTFTTTTSPIWNAWPRASIQPNIDGVTRLSDPIGKAALRSLSNAWIAASKLIDGCARAIRSAGGVSRYAQTEPAQLTVNARTAALSSRAYEGAFAVSVASTWEPDGSAEVYNLQVADAPEYFANGILVHNCDELAKWRYAQETWDMLQFGLRLGDNPRQLVTTTPRPIPLLRNLMKDPTTVVTKGSTFENEANLAPTFITQITKKYEGTRLGRQELNAEVLDDVPGSLWTRDGLDRHRWEKSKKLPDMQRIVVAVDPAATTKEAGDTTAETGIVVAGLGVDGRGYVLDDLTCALSPNGWARVAVSGYDRYSCDAIVVETNQGGEMVKQTVQSVRDVNVIEVRASRGKVTRAEPVSALYEQGRISHVGGFAALEDQMVLFTTNGIIGETTADRVDALVWAFTELFPSMVNNIGNAIEWCEPARSPGGWMAS